MLGLSHTEIFQQEENTRLPGSFSITLHHRSGIREIKKNLNLVLMFLLQGTGFVF